MGYAGIWEAAKLRSGGDEGLVGGEDGIRRSLKRPARLGVAP